MKKHSYIIFIIILQSMVICIGFLFSKNANAKHTVKLLNDTSNRVANIYVADNVADKSHILQACEEQHTKGFHLFSHGKPGQLLIDGEWKNAVQIASWLSQNRISQNYNYIHIYGCEFAKGDEGKKVIGYLEAMLAVQIAASNDITGIDGDWELEVGNANNAIKGFNYAYNLQSCDCTDYIYLNDPSGNIVHKFAIPDDPTSSTFHEVGSPWLAAGTIDSPHGIGTDVNGNLYINALHDQQTYQILPDGTVLNSNYLQEDVAYLNSFSIENTLYVTENIISNNNLSAFNLCTGEKIGSVCINGGSLYLWGLQLGADGCMYASTNRNSDDDENAIFKICNWTEQDFIDETCYDPFIDEATISTNSSIDNRVMGVTADEAGNVYFITASHHFNELNTITCIQKYDNTGVFIGEICDNTNGDGGFFGAQGIVYKDGYLFTGAFEQCLGVVNATSLTFVFGAGVLEAGPVKAIGITTECCPSISPIVVDSTICTTGGGELIFLQDVLSCAEGIIVGGSWAETTNTSGGNIVYNNCNTSVAITGAGCASYTLEKTTPASSVQQCAPYNITLNICMEILDAEVTTSVGGCVNNQLIDNANISISNVSNADQANYSLGSTYTGAPYNDLSGISLFSGTGSFSDLLHDTYYTVRIWNGGNDCFIDEVIKTPPACACIEAITDTLQICANAMSPAGESLFNTSNAIGAEVIFVRFDNPQTNPEIIYDYSNNGAYVLDTVTIVNDTTSINTNYTLSGFPIFETSSETFYVYAIIDKDNPECRIYAETVVKLNPAPSLLPTSTIETCIYAGEQYCHDFGPSYTDENGIYYSHYATFEDAQAGTNEMQIICGSGDFTVYHRCIYLDTGCVAYGSTDVTVHVTPKCMHITIDKL